MERKSINQKREVKKRLLWGRRIEECINGIRKDLSVLAQIKRRGLKERSMKKKRLPRENRTQVKENVGG
jgi:hypothetical protein